MPDPNAVQNLCDALRSFALPSTTGHGVYDLAKDFQTFFAALIAGCTATAAALIAYRAANLNYRGVVDQIKERADVAARERDRRKLGAFLRLKAELQTFESFTSSTAEKMKRQLDDLEARVPIPEIGQDPVDVIRYLDAEDERIVSFKPVEFPELEELDVAWSNIDLYPDMAIQPIDHLRRKLHWVKRLPDREWIRAVVKDGMIPAETADYFRIEILDLARTSASLIRIVETEIPAIKNALK